MVSVRGLRHVNEPLLVPRSGALVGVSCLLLRFLLLLYDGVIMSLGEFQYFKFM